MRRLALLFVLASLATPAAAQTIEQRVDKIILDLNIGKNATARAEAEAKRLKADLAKQTPPVVVVPPIVTPPVVPPVIMPPMEHSLSPFVDLTKIPAPAVGYSTARIRAETVDIPTPNANGTGQFRFVCEPSHFNFDDAIVYPGQKDKAHLHINFGNTGLNYATTQQSLETTGNSTCAGGTANRTGYWTPAVIDTKDGSPVKPAKLLLYYKSDFLPGATTNLYPAGLRIIAGNMKSTGPQDRTDWGCYTPDGRELRGKSIPADCPVGGIIEATIEFPMCWNGKDLDSPDHKSHMAFTVWNNDKRVVECPSTHPVQVPTLTEKVQYNVTEAGASARWRLSSDNYGTDKPGGFSIHADWFNAWDPKVQKVWVDNCLRAARDCHGFLLGDGTTLY